MIDGSTFQPDWVSPPGETISDFLHARGLSTQDLAQEIDSSLEKVEELLHGDYAINTELAKKLNNTLGGSANFWLSREKQFRANQERLSDHEAWVNSFPLREMAKFGWTPDTKNFQERINVCLKYFDVPTIADWFRNYEGNHRIPAFRTSPTFSSDEIATLVWLRKGEIESSKIECNEWNQEAFVDSLPSIRKLTREKRPEIFIPRLRELCSNSGVSLVVAQCPKECKASGATKLLSSKKAMIMMSGRYLSDDHFWFTFFHEAGHLVLHKEFIENCEESCGEQESEANQFAFDTLIPKDSQDELFSLQVDTRKVMRFARKIGVSPGIIVGQLQNHGHCPQNMLNKLKTRYKKGQLVSA